MTSNTEHELNQWLDEATKALPAKVNAHARQELQTHYEDAVEAHSAQGQSPFEAHRAALAELGDAKEIARALRETHLAERRYAIAAMLALLYPMSLFVTLGPLGGYDFLSIFISNALLLIPSLYILSAFRLLLRGRFNFECANGAIALVSAGLVVLTTTPTIATLLLGQPTATQMLRVFGEGASPLQPAFDAVAALGVFIAGGGLVWLAERLMFLENSLYGLRLPFRLMAFLLGASLMSFAVAVTLNATTLALFSNVFILLFATVTYCLWTLIFFRAAYRGVRLHTPAL
jgi:hypothetical protein